MRSIDAWRRARALRLAEKRVAETFLCELVEVDDDVPCTRSAKPFDAWCQTCQARDPYFRKMVNLKRIERGYFKALCALVDRRARKEGLDGGND